MPDETPLDRPDYHDRVARLRAELSARGLHGFIIPRSDEHQGEDVPACSERLLWISGFGGTAGTAIVMVDKAAIFVDGRYTLQVRDQVAEDLFAYRHLIEEPPKTWLLETVGPGQKIAFDPWLMTRNQVARYQAAVEKAGGELVAVDDNPLDAVWLDRPPAPKATIRAHGLEYTGLESSVKRERVAETLSREGLDAVVLGAPDSIAWLLNVRGGDLPNAPQPLSFAIVNKNTKVEWFVDPDKPEEGLGQFLGPDVIRHEPGQLGAALDALGKSGASVGLNANMEPEWIHRRLKSSGATVRMVGDPCALPKAIKTSVELAGMRSAHLRDAVAVVRFLHWLDTVASRQSVTEIDASDQLEAFRRENHMFRGLSFPTISAAAANGAIVHYRATAKTNKTLEQGSLYLVDSGAQYPDGTTDVTRTIAIGEPTGEMAENFTRVLKGHIAIADARFPKGTTGSQLDPFARRALWEIGLDYDHGTGHGVGSYLNVHEGPHRIAKGPNAVALQPGMIISNEPGYYKTGAYGIRIENLVAVTGIDPPSGAEREMYGFETLTLAPIDLRLVVPSLLDETEVNWLDSYHLRVREGLLPLLANKGEDVQNWLVDATQPVTATRALIMS